MWLYLLFPHSPLPGLCQPCPLVHTPCPTCPLCAHARGRRRDNIPTPSLLWLGYTTPQVYGPALPTCLPPLHTCWGHGRDQGGAHKGGCTQRGGGGKECKQASRAAHKWKGVCTLSTPPVPSRLA